MRLLQSYYDVAFDVYIRVPARDSSKIYTSA